MADKDIKIISPLAGRAPINKDVALHELELCGKINLRGDRADNNFTSAVGLALNTELPKSNTALQNDDINIFWLGPDEWLIHCPLDRVAEHQNKLHKNLTGLHHAVTEVSDYYALLELSGANSAAVLARACPLDLRPSAFAINNCAQTKFANAAVLLLKPREDCFHIQVRWSFANYVWDYLAEIINLQCYL